MYSELRIDINQEVDVVGHDLGLEQDAVRFLSHFGHDLLEPPIGPLTITWRRYFGQKTTWSFTRKDNVAIRSALHPEIYGNGLYNHLEGGAFLPYG